MTWGGSRLPGALVPRHSRPIPRLPGGFPRREGSLPLVTGMLHHERVSVPATSGAVGVRHILTAGVATAVGAVPVAAGFSADTIPTAALYSAGWPAFGLCAALVADRDNLQRLTRVLMVLALFPMGVVAAASTGRRPLWLPMEEIWASAGVWIVLLALVALCAAVGYTPHRTARRRLWWLLSCSCVVAASVTAASVTAPHRTSAVVMTLMLWALAGVVVRLSNASELRPLAEPLADLVTGVAILAAGAVAGIVFRLVGARAGIPLLEASATFAAVVMAALAWPAAMTARKRWLARRYGPGTLTTDDVAAITADLHARAEPREVLGKAAEMVATSSGLPEALIVLGQDHDEVPRDWVEHPLVVGGDRVGSLLVYAEDPDGPEQRQRRIVEQLLPTVSLVCLAVSLAVDAQHARRDLVRERDHERARILGDLHDGLGPVLAGMSMRVEAELGRNPTLALEALAEGLAESRGDLRRIVGDLAPSALDGIDLDAALARLVSSFQGGGHRVLLATKIPCRLSDPLEVAVYRSVAEGVTNALRHGRAAVVTVSVTASPDGGVHVQVDDDGTAGIIVPGVGLTSLRRRAEDLGGSLLIESPPNGGTRLRVDFLPAGST